MSRNYRALRVFVLADALVVDVYRASRGFPPDERFGLRSQIRRAATSAATNIVEGSTRRSDKAYVTFLETALGSASETGYLLSVAMRVGAMETEVATPIIERYTSLARQLEALIGTIRTGRADVHPRSIAGQHSSRKLKAES
jgi:four helix bundle protein